MYILNLKCQNHRSIKDDAFEHYIYAEEFRSARFLS